MRRALPAANARRLHIYSSEIGAWGESAGGHLVALAGTAGSSAGWDVGPYAGVSSTIQAVVDMAGPSDLLTMGNLGDAVLVAEEFDRLLGTIPKHNLGADLPADSPVTYVKHGDPPFLILQSTNDTWSTPSRRRSWPGIWVNACPTGWSWTTAVATNSMTPAGSPTRPRSRTWSCSSSSRPSSYSTAGLTR